MRARVHDRQGEAHQFPIQFAKPVFRTLASTLAARLAACTDEEEERAPPRGSVSRIGVEYSVSGESSPGLAFSLDARARPVDSRLALHRL